MPLHDDRFPRLRDQEDIGREDRIRREELATMRAAALLWAVLAILAVLSVLTLVGL